MRPKLTVLAPSPAPRGDDATDLQQYADRLRGRWQASVEAIVAVGTELLAIKDTCGHGAFERLFRGHPSAIARPVPFSVRTARRLMEIARHPVLANRTHGSELPPSWRTLATLARLPADVLEAAIADGRVHSEIERRDAEQLMRDRGDDPEVARVASAISGRIAAETLVWPATRLRVLAKRLVEIADAVEARAARGVC